MASARLSLCLVLQTLISASVAAASPTSHAVRLPLQSGVSSGSSTSSSSSSIMNAAVTGPGQPALIAATCRLVLRGHHADFPAGPPAAISDAVTADQGLTSISLACNTTPPGLAVPVGVNSTWVSADAVAAWQGVYVPAQPLDCQRLLGRLQVPILGVIAFCGNYSLTFTQLDMRGVHIHSPLLAATKFIAPWRLALVVLGGSTRARVEGARILHNNAGSAVAVANDAVAEVTAGSVMVNNRAVFGAGAVVLDRATFILSGNSSISNNTAYHSGGAIHGSGSSLVVIQGGSQLSFNSAPQYGGALQGDELCSIVVRDALLLNNTSTYGGATAIKNSVLLQVEAGAVYKDNYADFGGCVAVQSSAIVIAGKGAVFSGNSGQYGGVVAAQNQCNITLAGALLVANTATYGGCLAVQDNAAISVKHGTVFRDNVASYGGGIAIQNGGGVVVSGAEFTNCSGNYGGAVALQNTATLEVSGGSLIRRCKARFGGAIAAVEEARITLRDCAIRECDGWLGGAVCIVDTAQLRMNGTLVTNNTANKGGGLAATLQSRITLASSNLTHNFARSDGGAIYLQDNSSLDFGRTTAASSNIDNTDVPSNNSTAATARTSTSRVMIAGNRAKTAGGGIAITGHSSFDVAAVLQGLHDNSAEFDAEASVPLRHISVVGPSFISGLASRFNRTIGTLGITVNLTGIGGLPCGGRPVQVTLQPSPAVQVLGAAKSNAQGLALLSEVKLRATPGLYTLAVASTTDKDVEPALVHVEVRACVVGETTNELGDACEPCNPGSYSLDPKNFTCDACPLHASCPGGSALLPLEGYWHSSHMSPQIHACPNAKACSANRSTLLPCLPASPTLNSSSNSSCLHNASSPALAAYSDSLCELGYSGNLCGVCRPGHGAVTAFSCLPCMPRSTAVALYVTATIVALLFVRLLAYITIADNENCAAVAASAQAAVLPARVQAGRAPPEEEAPPKDASQPFFVPEALSLTSLPGSGPPPEPDADSAASPFTKVQRGLGQQGIMPTHAAHHRTGVRAGTPSVLSNASKCVSSRSLPAREEPAPGFSKHLRPSTSAAEGACQTTTPPSWPGNSSSEKRVESISSMGSTGGLAGAPAAAASGPACGAGAKPSNSVNASGALHCAGAGAGGFDCCRASDILKVLVLYLQYMLLVGSLRVPWPPTLLLPFKALAWFLAASTSQTLSLECVIDAAQLPPGLPMAMVRVLFYTLMPLATFVLLWLVDVLVRLGAALLPLLAALVRNRMQLLLPGHYTSSMLRGSEYGGPGAAGCEDVGDCCSWPVAGQRMKKSFESLGRTTIVLLMVCLFFYLPSVLRYGLSMFVCVKLDDPRAPPYAWATASPGSYFLLDLNEECWAPGGWHRVWALAYGVPVLVLLCCVLPLGLAGVVWANRLHLHAPWFMRRYGWVVRVYRPERAAWEAVVVVQTIMMCVCAVFGMALGVYHQTLLTAAVCAGFAVLLMVFEPHEHRQLQLLLVYAFGSLFVTLMAALSFLTSFNDIEPPYAYSFTMGAVVLGVNVAYIAWAVYVLKTALEVQWPARRIMNTVLQLLSKFAPFRLATNLATYWKQRSQQQRQKGLWRQTATESASIP